MSIYYSGPIVLGEKWSRFEQEEMLSLHLEPLLGKHDSLTLSKNLIAHFGSLPAVLSANKEQLIGVSIISNQVFQYLYLLRDITIRLASAEIDLHEPIIGSVPALLKYCQAQMSGTHVEQARVIYLNKKSRLIADKFHSSGTVDQVIFQLRDVARTAVLLNASSLILVHNHPSGDPEPSPADLSVTRDLMSVLAPLRITVSDHLIIGKSGHFSFLESGWLSAGCSLSTIEIKDTGLKNLKTVLSGGTTRSRRRPSTLPVPSLQSLRQELSRNG